MTYELTFAVRLRSRPQYAVVTTVGGVRAEERCGGSFARAQAVRLDLERRGLAAEIVNESGQRVDTPTRPAV